ncbi:DUF2971 domain-containing protein [Bacillus cereus]|uniref:DUF2971 domain-containing protein n=1 Tax=Bacillus cereus TaxID=1396 RepID=UPI000BEDAFC2|nr:DUF2971 domain-containing protein [Bacillus cereus]PED32362.1 DUF2971 domain-containing protein [Bacillus cereus]PEE49926.1 DUF2971 domain-containing protein [Bacillus cereus]PFL87544.1 DUF2971 domain-containing protein [Bacillus cereus]
MGYTFEQWRVRYSKRSDISSYLVHLTRPVYNEKGEKVKSSLKVLNEILTSKKLIGSTTKTGYIIGKNKAVCFQDMPLHSVCQNALFEELETKDKTKRRYVPIGIAFPKQYVYQKGGRPVIYEKKEVAKKILPEDEWWRIVNLNLDDTNNYIDWMHEREWRLKGDFEFELSRAIVLFSNGKVYRAFIKNTDEKILQELSGINMMAPIIL